MNNNEKVTGLDSTIDKIKVAMIKDKNISGPTYTLNKQYSFQYYQDGDRTAWAKIQCKVNHFSNMQDAYTRFDNEFGKHLELLKERLLFVIDSKNNKVATAMMWFMEGSNQRIQRIHWVAVDPDHQGQRISHAMLTEILHKYKDEEIIYLTTQTWSYRAISIYYQFGFVAYPFEDIKKLTNLNLKEIKNSKFETKKLEDAWTLINNKIR